MRFIELLLMGALFLIISNSLHAAPIKTYGTDVNLDDYCILWIYCESTGVVTLHIVNASSLNSDSSSRYLSKHTVHAVFKETAYDVIPETMTLSVSTMKGNSIFSSKQGVSNLRVNKKGNHLRLKLKSNQLGGDPTVAPWLAQNGIDRGILPMTWLREYGANGGLGININFVTPAAATPPVVAAAVAAGNNLGHYDPTEPLPLIPGITGADPDLDLALLQDLLGTDSDLISVTSAITGGAVITPAYASNVAGFSQMIWSAYNNAITRYNSARRQGQMIQSAYATALARYQQYLNSLDPIIGMEIEIPRPDSPLGMGHPGEDDDGGGGKMSPDELRDYKRRRFH